MFILLLVLAAFAGQEVTSKSLREIIPFDKEPLDDESSDIYSFKYNDIQRAHYINEYDSAEAPLLYKEWTKTSKDAVYLDPGETTTFSFTFGEEFTSTNIEYELSNKSPPNSILFSCDISNPRQKSLSCDDGNLIIQYGSEILRFCSDNVYSSLENVNAGTQLKIRAFTNPSSSLTNVDCEIFAMSCGKRNVNRIIGGKESLVHEFPWQVSFGYRDSRPFNFCGGSIITQSHILTAAHCFYSTKGDIDSWNSKTIALVGMYDFNNISYSIAKTKPLEITKVTLHENFDYDTARNDIAIVKVAESIPFAVDNTISPVCLPSNPKNMYSNVETIVSGFGNTIWNDDYSMSPVLLHYIGRTISLVECQKSYSTTITDDMICILPSERNQSSTCQGDSGGPLMYQNGDQVEQIGVVSFGSPQCQPEFPNVFTRVTSYLEWIARHTK